MGDGHVSDRKQKTWTAEFAWLRISSGSKEHFAGKIEDHFLQCFCVVLS